MILSLYEIKKSADIIWSNKRNMANLIINFRNFSLMLYSVYWFEENSNRDLSFPLLTEVRFRKLAEISIVSKIILIKKWHIFNFQIDLSQNHFSKLCNYVFSWEVMFTDHISFQLEISS
jgi:hypothetical protein